MREGDGVWPVVSAATMRALDRHTIEVLGVSGELLMESAGRAVAEAVLERLPRGGRALVVCGGGNNGGDGWVAARHLRLLGVDVTVRCVSDPGRLRGDAAANRTRALAVGLEGRAGAPDDLDGPPPAVVVDAIFGTGLARDVEGNAAAWIEAINALRAHAHVVAVDLPSGLHADTGRVLGVAVEADRTVTLGLPKLGLALEPGRTLAGRVRVARIGISDTAPDAAADAAVLTQAAAGRRLPARPRAAHKGSFGHVLVVAGSEGKTGAAALAARGAGRTGAGLVTVACPAGLNDVLEVKCTEAMTVALPDTGERCLAAAAEKAVLDLAASRDGVALGPGLGTHRETVALVRAAAAAIEQPLVVDADGLNALAGAAAVLRGRRAPAILTPHPGEAARLLDASAAAINADRIGSARRLAGETGCVVLLKGAGSVVAEPDGRTAVNPTGGPALASGGTGDVLTGVAAALLGQGASPFDAAVLAAFLHGHAADRIAARRGAGGLLASELADELPAAADSLRAAAGRADRAVGPALAPSFPEP